MEIDDFFILSLYCHVEGLGHDSHDYEISILIRYRKESLCQQNSDSDVITFNRVSEQGKLRKDLEHRRHEQSN